MLWARAACLLLSAATAIASQSPLLTTSKTLVDVLSDDPDGDYTSLLRLLQITRLIPTLNKLDGCTLFAPTNTAIERNAVWTDALQTPISPEERDNIHEKLRQELLYHLLNYTLFELPESDRVTVEKTLHFPRIPIPPPTHEPPPSPPWLPLPGGSLGGEPQRVRLSTREGDSFVGVDAFGAGGGEIVKPRAEAVNGVIYGMGDVLEVPRDLASVLEQHKGLEYFRSLLTPVIETILNSTPGVTLFLPVDEAWKSLSDIERRYLESPFSTDDLNRVLGMHAVVEDGVHWSDSFQPSLNLTSLDGKALEIVVTDDGTTITSPYYQISTTLSEPDIYASNGVIHTVSSLFFPSQALALTPEKYLLTLNCTRFVSLLHESNLTGLINNTETKRTILAPSDDVLSLMKGTDELPANGSSELSRLLSYHFIPGLWTPKNLKGGILIDTELKEKGLDGQAQVMDVEVVTTDDKTKKSMRFGGAAVIGDPVEVDNTLIYFVSRTIQPPGDALQAALPNIDLSAFLAAIFSTSLADKLRLQPRATFLLPTNEAFKRLGGLVSKHLLASSSQSDLELVIKHHVISGVEYSHSLSNGSQQSYPTLDGTDLRVERLKEGVFVSASGGWSGMKAKIEPLNMLTRTGVVHQASDILLPRSLNLTVGKLVKAAQGSTMTSLVVKAGMEWLLNGTTPPDDSPWADMNLAGSGWTLLCPTDDAFKGINLTALYNYVNLREIVAQHVIPTPRETDGPRHELWAPLNNNKPLPFSESATFSTLLSPTSAYGDLVFRQEETVPPDTTGHLLVGIKGARGTDGEADWARVQSWGRSTTGRGIGGVIQIDRVLVPYRPPWWIEYVGPIAVGIIGAVAMGIFFYLVRLVWRRDTEEATYEPVGGFGAEDSEDA